MLRTVKKLAAGSIAYPLAVVLLFVSFIPLPPYGRPKDCGPPYN